MNLDFDLTRYIRFILPTFLRKAKMKAFIKVLLIHVEELFLELKTFYTQVIDELQTSILTDVLQAKLRLIYPNVGSFKVFVKSEWENYPTIYIQNLGEHHKQEFAYTLAEAQPPKYIWNRVELNLAFDYVVIVPVAYTSSLGAITVFLNKFKPAGKRYIISFQNIT